MNEVRLARYTWEALAYKLFGNSLMGESRGGRASSGGGLGVSPRFPSSPSPLARERGTQGSEGLLRPFYFYRRDKSLRGRDRLAFYTIITKVWGQQS